MLELTGKCCNGIKAVEFFESLADVINEDAKTEEFCEEFEAAMNRLRYEVAKGFGKRSRLRKAAKSWNHDEYLCGECGSTIYEAVWEYCPKCGTKIIR